jgi:hypothetical protein
MTNKRGAPTGNQNRRKHPAGAVIKTALYLTPADIEALDDELIRRAEPTTDADRRALARDILTRALHDLRDRRADEAIII